MSDPVTALRDAAVARITSRAATIAMLTTQIDARAGLRRHKNSLAVRYEQIRARLQGEQERDEELLAELNGLLTRFEADQAGAL